MLYSAKSCISWISVIWLYFPSHLERVDLARQCKERWAGCMYSDVKYQIMIPGGNYNKSDHSHCKWIMGPIIGHSLSLEKKNLFAFAPFTLGKA